MTTGRQHFSRSPLDFKRGHPHPWAVHVGGFCVWTHFTEREMVTMATLAATRVPAGIRVRTPTSASRRAALARCRAGAEASTSTRVASTEGDGKGSDVAVFALG